MATLTFKSEKNTQYNKLFKNNYEHQLDNSDKQITVDSILDGFDNVILLNELPLKCGRGGSHVWVSNLHNERIIIVTIQ